MMQLGDSRPSSVLGHGSDWPPRTLADAGPSSGPPPSSFAQSSTIAQRRRSSVLHPPPQAPPPSQPIPRVPIVDTTAYDSNHRQSDSLDTLSPSGTSPNLAQFSRPLASPNLAAVAAFSQARFAATSQSPPPPPTSSRQVPDMPRSSHFNTTRHQDIVPDRLLLSAKEALASSSSHEPRPSSRRALTKALELAREAVKLDSTNDDPYGAVIAYGKSVALLSKVMERVMRGEDSTETHRKRGGRRRSVVAQEEEVKRLKAIHDTYADRMNILSLIYSIPPIPHSPTSLYTASISASTDSTQPSSPTTGSPSSESSDHIPFTPSLTTDDDSDGRRLSEEMTVKADGDLYLNGDLIDGLPAPSVHPYAAAPARISIDLEPSYNPPSTAPLSNRIPIVPSGRPARPRAASALPPPTPPPQSSLPPAPETKHLNVASRPRGNSTGHVRTGSHSKLASLREESERLDEQPIHSFPQPHSDAEEEYRRPRTRSILKVQQDANRDSHPLPPLPPPSEVSSNSPITPRTVSSSNHDRGSPPSSTTKATPRPRGASTASTRSELGPLPNGLINQSTVLGTISQRRSKASAPPSSGSPTFSESVPLSAMKLSTSTGLPVASSAPQPYGRSRASSQPGNRPNIAGLPPASFDIPSRPPSSTSSVQNGGPPRKSTTSSKSHLPQITVLTGMMSPGLGTPITQLVPPPPIPHNNLPTTPTSPLPPAPPADAMRKPYHMMNLLRHTMTSKSGGYITRRLHVPHEVWSQGGAKLLNLPEKVRVVEVLCSALEELQTTSGELFGGGNVSSGMAMGIGGIDKKEGDLWLAKLEEFSAVCDGVVSNFGKKLGVGEGFAVKKAGGVAAWGGRLTRRFGELTNAKNLDSPASYVAGLSKLFIQAQLLDEHSKALTMQPIAPTYAALPLDSRNGIEAKLRRSSEFFATVVLTFVIRDLAQLLDKYVKKCEKWLEE